MANEKRLIDANEVKKRIWYGNSDPSYMRQYASGFIDNAPTVDAVEVVRCKDCKYYTEQKKRCDHPCQDWDVECYDQWLEVEPSDFCSYGERREDNVE